MQWMDSMSDPELLDVLPQLVQVTLALGLGLVFTPGPGVTETNKQEVYGFIK